MFLKFLDVSESADPANNLLSLILTIVPFILLALIFYFMIMRPQKKQQRELSDMRENISKGDIVTTNGGIVGVVVNIKDEMVLIETGGDKTTIQVQKWSIKTIEQKKDE